MTDEKELSYNNESFVTFFFINERIQILLCCCFWLVKYYIKTDDLLNKLLGNEWVNRWLTCNFIVTDIFDKVQLFIPIFRGFISVLQKVLIVIKKGNVFQYFEQKSQLLVEVTSYNNIILRMFLQHLKNQNYQGFNFNVTNLS